MKNPKYIFLAIAVAALALLGVALYLQFVQKMQPCPWCVIQRYAFSAIALISAGCATLSSHTHRVRAGAGFGLLVALGGLGAAGWHLWIKAHPALSCGIDPLETSLNTIFPARLMPFLFQADGLCSADYAPILGLSVPQWSFLWFAVFAILLARLAFTRSNR